MVILDIILLIILGLFVFYGFFFGLIRAVGMLAAVVAGSWVAAHFYDQLFSWVRYIWPGNPQIGKTVSFIILFSVVTHIVGWLFALLNQTLNIASIIPFLKTANRLLGAVFGLAEGVLLFGLTFYISGRYIPEQLMLAQWIKDSTLAKFLINISKVFAPLLPKLYQQLKDIL